jgi:hypothetical protein
MSVTVPAKTARVPQSARQGLAPMQEHASATAGGASKNIEARISELEDPN